jgi:hypothetical protein
MHNTVGTAGPGIPRPITILIIIISFSFLVFAAWREIRLPPQHGLRVNQTPQGMIITWVQPAGLAWDNGLSRW